MSDEYVHTNSINYSSKGTHCTLCRAILKQDQQFTTTKGCITCCVPLCLSSNPKFIDPSESCEYRWHYVIDLESLESPLLRKRGITGLVRGAVGSLLSLNKQRNRKRRRSGRRSGR